jgi:hypothetical protein
LNCSDCRRYSAKRCCDGAKHVFDRSTSCYRPAGLLPGYIPNTISRRYTGAELTNSRILVRYRTTTVRRQEGRETKTRLDWQVRRKDARPSWSMAELMGRTDPCRRERATTCKLAGKGSGFQRLGMSKFGLWSQWSLARHLEIAVGSGSERTAPHLTLMPVMFRPHMLDVQKQCSETMYGACPAWITGHQPIRDTE